MEVQLTRASCLAQEALKPAGGKKELSLADFKKVMVGLTDTTPTAEIVNAFKVFDKDVRQALAG